MQDITLEIIQDLHLIFLKQVHLINNAHWMETNIVKGLQTTFSNQNIIIFN